jgi:hypothetical protein
MLNENSGDLRRLMKKLSARHKRLLVYRSRKRLNRIKKRKLPKNKMFSVLLWDGEREEVAVCRIQPMPPPEQIDFDQNIIPTLDFLKSVRDRVGKKKTAGSRRLSWIRRYQNRPPQIGAFYDFGLIKNLAVAPALVVAASYDRAKRIVGTTPPAVNYTKWGQSALQTFYEIGFFDLIGQKQNNALVAEYERKASNQIKIVKAISGINANGLEHCSREISSLLDFLELDNEAVEFYIPEINTAISEAMINVAKHAYPEQYVSDSPYDTVNQWWMTARADRHASSITIVVYDQGASIPGTLPRRGWFKDIIQEFMEIFVQGFEYSEEARHMDHHYINYSMKPGKTQTKERERGLGLPQMRELIDQCKGGSLTIVSRSGLYRYSKHAGIESKLLPVELEGTLIEWHLSLPYRIAH